MKRVTIKDIAEHAKVSRGTVDRVLHGRGKVAPDVERAVQAAIEVLGYKPNIIARTLAQNKTYRISVLIPEPTQDPFWEFAACGVQRIHGQVADYGVLIKPYYFDVTSPVSYLREAQRMLADRPSGIVLAAEFYQESVELLAQIKEANIPTCLINTEMDEEKSFIGQDAFSAGRLGGQLFDMLIGDPAAQIAVVNLGPKAKNAQHITRKMHGFAAYLGDERRDKLVTIDIERFSDISEVRSALETMMASSPNVRGLFITNSRSYFAMQAIDQMSLKHPLKIIGFDLLQENIKYLKEGKIDILINQNPIQQAELAVSRLVDEIVFKKIERSTTFLPMDIIVRENVDFYNEDFR